jgi:molybdopterin/thiamine biosynthesis adenylyltransferase
VISISEDAYDVITDCTDNIEGRYPLFNTSNYSRQYYY